MSILELKKKYNAMLARADKAHKWMDAPTTSRANVDEWLLEYNKVIINLSTMIQGLELLLERKMTEDEILKGFK